VAPTKEDQAVLRDMLPRQRGGYFDGGAGGEGAVKAEGGGWGWGGG